MLELQSAIIDTVAHAGRFVPPTIVLPPAASRLGGLLEKAAKLARDGIPELESRLAELKKESVTLRERLAASFEPVTPEKLSFIETAIPTLEKQREDLAKTGKSLNKTLAKFTAIIPKSRSDIREMVSDVRSAADDLIDGGINSIGDIVLMLRAVLAVNAEDAVPTREPISTAEEWRKYARTLRS